MKTVEIIKGTYGYRPGPGKSTKPIYMGKTVDLPDAEADRLVKLRVARHVIIPAPGEEAPPAGTETPPGGTENDGQGNTFPDDKYGVKGQEHGQEDGGGEMDGPALEIEGGHYTKDSLLKLTRESMEKMAVNLGLPPEAIRSCRHKNDLADRLAEIEIAAEEAESGEQPPGLEADAPVL